MTSAGWSIPQDQLWLNLIPADTDSCPTASNTQAPREGMHLHGLSAPHPTTRGQSPAADTARKDFEDGFLIPTTQGKQSSQNLAADRIAEQTIPRPPHSLSIFPDLTHSYLLPRAARACRIMQRPCWGHWCSSPQEYSHGNTAFPSTTAPRPPHQHSAPFSLFPAQVQSKERKEIKKGRKK